jgi:predicted MFS family arabinose efflux permease
MGEEIARVSKSGVGALVLAELVSVLGTRMTYLALPWFVLVTTGSAGKMSLVLAAELVPMALLGVPSGTLVQRLGSRKTMLVSDFARAPLLASIPLLHASGHLSFGLLLALVFVLGCFMAPYFASQRVILPQLVGEDERVMSQANSLIEGGTGAALMLGPALAGLLIPSLGAPNVLYVDAATYAVSFLLVLAFVPRPGAPAATGDDDHGILGGLGFLRHDPLLGPMALVVIGFGFVSGGFSAGLPVYAYDVFDGSARLAGLFYSALGAGAVVGSLVAVGAVRKIAPLRLSAFAILGFAAPMWVLPLLPPAPVVATALFVAMCFTPLINAPSLAVLTARTPENLRAKVMTAVISINTVATPAGLLLSGQVLERWGVVPLFAGVATGITLMGLAYFAIVVRHREANVALEPTVEAGV